MPESESAETRTLDAGAVPPQTCRRHAAREPLLATVGWLIAALAAVSVAAVPYDFGESLCGVWGCFPPIAALAAMHLLWCVGFAAGIRAVSHYRRHLLRPIGMVLVLSAVGATALIVGGDLNRWLNIPNAYRPLWPKRVGYVLAVTTDVPLLQTLGAGIVCLVLARRHRVRRDSSAESGEEACRIVATE